MVYEGRMDMMGGEAAEQFGDMAVEVIGAVGGAY